MTSIRDIPYDDVIIFLSLNNVDIPLDANHDDVYTKARNIIYINDDKVMSIAIEDFIIAQHLIKYQIKIQPYKISDILSSSNDDLLNLSRQLILPYVDKPRIIRILKYMRRLDK